MFNEESRHLYTYKTSENLTHRHPFLEDELQERNNKSRKWKSRCLQCRSAVMRASS